MTGHPLLEESQCASEMLRFFQTERLLWDDVTGDLAESRHILTVMNRGMPKPGNFELRLADGQSFVMRSGALMDAVASKDAVIRAGNTAYFTLNASWK